VSLRVNVRPAAQHDLDEAARWYESHRAGLGDEFLDEFLATTSRIGEAPLAYPEIGRAARRAMLRRFPFGVFYRIADDSVVVVAVMHSSRHPRRWMRRV
jgi:plasmid stabilization system protein ParE